MVLLNAGAVRRTGPSRMWVECARRWAADGLTILRLDVEGIGDSDGATTPYVKDDSLYVPELVPQVQSAIDFLQARTEGERFILGGLCAGAYWSFHAALRDPRVSAILMLNPACADLGYGPGTGPRPACPAHPARVAVQDPSPRYRAAAAGISALGPGLRRGGGCARFCSATRRPPVPSRSSTRRSSACAVPARRRCCCSLRTSHSTTS